MARPVGPSNNARLYNINGRAFLIVGLLKDVVCNTHSQLKARIDLESAKVEAQRLELRLVPIGDRNIAAAIIKEGYGGIDQNTLLLRLRLARNKAHKAHSTPTDDLRLHISPIKSLAPLDAVTQIE
jgi:hypothetical protein